MQFIVVDRGVVHVAVAVDITKGRDSSCGEGTGEDATVVEDMNDAAIDRRDRVEIVSLNVADSDRVDEVGGVRIDASKRRELRRQVDDAIRRPRTSNRR